MEYRQRTIRVLGVGRYTIKQKQILENLNAHTGIEFVGLVSTGEDAINFHSELKPDIILMDVILGSITGFETARWIKEQNNKIKIILLSTFINTEFLMTGLELGLEGYLSKDTNSGILKEAIVSTWHGERYYHKVVMEILPAFD